MRWHALSCICSKRHLFGPAIYAGAWLVESGDPLLKRRAHRQSAPRRYGAPLERAEHQGDQPQVAATASYHYGTLAPVSTQRPRTQRSSSVMPLMFASGIVRSTATRASILRAYCFICRAVSSMTPLGAIGKARLVGCPEWHSMQRRFTTVRASA